MLSWLLCATDWNHDANRHYMVFRYEDNQAIKDLYEHLYHMTINHLYA